MPFLLVFFVFAALAGISYYVASRFYQGFACFFPNVRFWPILTVFLLLAVIMTLGFGRSMIPFPDGIKHVLGLVSAYYMGILYIFCSSLQQQM